MALRSGLPILLVASTSFALPRPNSAVRAGANHHLGDASYIAAYGHPPGAHAGERDRMQRHLAFVRDWLASRPATRPALAARRAEILGYLDAYLAKRTTPKNDHVPWRTPVFIDDEGTICAVGYLIEQSVDPALPRRIARAHRYDFIEDIARAMPEVQAWVDGSGFTLEEIASIQPAYSEPSSNTWRTWDLAKHPPADGPYDQLGSRGVFRHGRMEGDWVAYHEPEAGGAELIVGRGHMVRGRGPWVSYDAAGHKIGEGRYANNRAEGPWKLYHPSGNLAAEGAFAHGDRTGRWRFYYDTPDRTPIAIGRFAGRGGRVVGTWRHFDQGGELLATTWAATPAQWHDIDWDIDGGSGFMLDIVARPGEVKHASHQGTVNSVPVALDMYALGDERIYLEADYDRATMFDQDGWKLERSDGAWRAADCRWSAKRKTQARRGDLVALHGALYQDARRRVNPTSEGPGDVAIDEAGPACGPPVAVSAARTAGLDAVMAARDQVRALTPAFVRSAVLGEEAAADPDAEPSDDDRAQRAKVTDLTRVLAANMAMYLEWPHIDGRFVALYGAMAGRVTWQWTDNDPEDGT